MYPLNNVYRKPYELYSGSAFVLGSIALSVAMPLTPIMTLPTAGIMLFYGSSRILSGYKILRYHSNLRRLPIYELAADEIPVSNSALFLGKGFRWDREHTQRLELARKPENIQLSRPTPMNLYFRNYEFHHDNFITRFTRSQSILNPFKPLPPVGGDTALHGIEPDEDDIYMNLGERVGHTLVLGTTRVGKTRFLETVVVQDIHRGDVVIVFDPKGDGDLLKRMYAEASRSGRPFFMFHLGHPKESCRYNPIGSYSRITEIATRIANQLPSEGPSSAFQQFVWRYVNVLAKTMEALGIKPTYEEIYKCASNIDNLAQQYMEQWLKLNAKNWEEKFEDFEFDDKEEAQARKQGRSPDAIKLASFMKQSGYQDSLADAISTILSNDRSYFEKLVSSLYPLLEKLTTGQISELISPDPTDPDDKRPIFDWMGVIQTGAVVYVGLDSLSDYEVAGAVGNAMFSDLTSLAGQLYKNGVGYGESTITKQKIRISVHADEFNELIGNEFIPMVNKAGGAGFQVTAYTQTWSDIEAKIGSAAKAGQIGGNFNTLIMLRVQNIETAQILIDKLPEVPIIMSTQLSGASDVSDPDDWVDFNTQNEDRIAMETVPMIKASDLVTLPKGQAFALIEGGQLYKIRMPLPKQDADPHMPENIYQIAKAMDGMRDSTYTPEEHLTIEGESYVY